MSIILENGKKVCEVLNVEYFHGKTEYSISPDFCGTATKIPRKKQFDKIVFTIPDGQELNGEYQLQYDEFNLFSIQILNILNGKVIALVNNRL